MQVLVILKVAEEEGRLRHVHPLHLLVIIQVPQSLQPFHVNIVIVRCKRLARYDNLLVPLLHLLALATVEVLSDLVALVCCLGIVLVIQQPLHPLTIIATIHQRFLNIRAALILRDFTRISWHLAALRRLIELEGAARVGLGARVWVGVGRRA